MDAVAPGLGAEIDHRQTCRRRGGVEDLVRVGQPHAHGVDQDVAVIAAVEICLARHRRHADAVAVAADPGHHPGHQPLGLRVTRIPEPQGVEQGDRARAHGEDVAHDPADARCGALVGLDERGVVVALHLEDTRLTIVDVDDACVLAGSADHPGTGRGKLGQVDLGALVGTVLGPHHRKHAQLNVVRLPPQALQDHRVLGGGQAIGSGLVGHGLGGGCGHAPLLAGLGRRGERARRSHSTPPPNLLPLGRR